MELPATQPLKLKRGLSSRNGFGAPDQWRSIKTAQFTGIVREQGSLPNAHGQNAVLHLIQSHRAKFKGLHGLRNVPNRARWQLAISPDLRAVPINFVGIVYIRHQKRELLRCAGGTDERDRTPVPGKTYEVGMALLTPRLVCA